MPFFSLTRKSRRGAIERMMYKRDAAIRLMMSVVETVVVEMLLLLVDLTELTGCLVEHFLVVIEIVVLLLDHCSESLEFCVVCIMFIGTIVLSDDVVV